MKSSFGTDDSVEAMRSTYLRKRGER